jgi:hypothetical protein
MQPLPDLLLYDDLPPEERRRADTYLAAHPEGWAEVEEGRRLCAMGRAAGPALSDDDLALLLVARREGPLSPRLRTLQERVEAAREEDPDLDARYRALEARLDAVLAKVPSPLEHLASLRATAPNSSDGRPPRADPSPRASDRPPATPTRRPRRAWGLALAAALLLAGLYLGLLRTEGPGQLPGERLAALPSVPESFEGLHLRGGGDLSATPAEAYDAALLAVHAARTPDAGPRYDEPALRAAHAQLLEVARRDAPDGAIGLEARFTAGRVALHLGDYAAARDAFRTVVEREGPSAPDAAALLAEMDRQGLR